ncbi:elongation of very long chain fatty acids protein 7-like isoform X2 [Phlebotomus papatasi]|uniref:elongation of very long chain fatty acids protein 7-like isoform X2 n=1 Tax=Phlebotomus papatasi TaxID=29031 RepID=UPI002483C548|nr:elongation of very long chain fatty acids protein 7-like isoform X2 [Phlebotomus papatasi]
MVVVQEMGYIDRIIHFFVVNQDPRTKDWFLSGSVGPLFTILVTYLYFCIYAGPRFMKDRKPLQLKNTLIVYNAIQVLLSVWLVYEGLESGWRKYYNFRCQPVDYSKNPIAMRMARAVWAYYMCKLVELLDTVFFVLRKKQNQISFLHLYHHTLMPVCAFIGLKYFAGGHGTLLGLINSFIHVIMYMYYMLAAMGPEVQKHLWWKKYLTTLQIIQFLIVFCHTIQVQFQPNCNFPKSIAALLTINAGLFTYMFSSFYIRNYTKRRSKDALDAKRRQQELNHNDVSKCSLELNGKAQLQEDFYPTPASPIYETLKRNGHIPDVKKKA